MKTSNSQCYSVHGNKTRPKESTRRSGQFLRGKVFSICHDLQASSSSGFLLPTPAGHHVNKVRSFVK
jgi:hypothetical protein